MKNTIYIILIISAFWACQDTDPIEPTDELPMNYGQLVVDTLYATADSFLVNERINTYNSNKLCIGHYKNFEASVLINFIILPDSGSLVDSVAIEFSTLSVLGQALVDMPVTLYKVEESWYENANTEDQWHTFNPTTEIATIQIQSEDSSRIKYTITDTTLIREWISDGIYNKGLFLKCKDPGINYLREIASMEYSADSLRPQITFRYWDDEDSVFATDTTYIGLDATIFTNNGNELFDRALSQNDILIASGIGARAYLQFDSISSLPQNIIIQKAEISLPIWDEDFEIPGQKNSLNNSNNIQDFYINSVLDLTKTELDSVYLNLVSLSEVESSIINDTNNDRARMGRYFIQNIINEVVETTWFSIQFQNEGQDLSIKRFRRTADDPARLILKYFKVEQSGF